MYGSFAPIWGSLVIFLFCPFLGGLPLIDWITYLITGRQLKQLGTGNISVSAAFYHGGKLVGILAVLSEAAKGILAVLLTRMFFPNGSVWEILALIALVMGRYWIGKGAGTTNATWGIFVHDPIAASLVLFIGLISFTINRDRKLGKLGVLGLLALIIGLRHLNNLEYLVAAIALGCLLAWIYEQIPDDLNLPASEVNPQSQRMFRFFRPDKTIISLDQKLSAQQAGSKSANLSLVKSLGYTVAEGWVLLPGDDFRPLLAYLNPSAQEPLVVRSSAIGEDSVSASAAGQYLSILNITSREELQIAIADCQASYLEKSAAQYRKTHQQATAGMAVLIQKQITGVYSGVAFSRDPVNAFSDGVAIEALAGQASQVVSGKVTPWRYQVKLGQGDNSNNSVTCLNGGEDGIPQNILESVAVVAREMETLFQGIPQDIEWSHDGEKLWLLQVRPITNLQPIWTRKIAAEVIPGQIPPLTWSLNRPLTCGVWGQIFTLVLGKKASDLDFGQTASLHYGRAYFNATLLGSIFLRMGLPPESLEFLTRGEKFSKPPLGSTVKNIPGLWRLLRREWHLETDFEQDKQKIFAPLFTEIESYEDLSLSSSAIIERIHQVLETLEIATYYNILAPLSFAIRQAILKVPLEELDTSCAPEIASMRSLAKLATDAWKLLAKEQITMGSCASLFAYLADIPEGQSIIQRFDNWLETYGYLGEVVTDISVPRWRDNPRPAREMLTQLFFNAESRRQVLVQKQEFNFSLKQKLVQTRFNLKGQVSEVYNKLLAYLRWSFLDLEAIWLQENILSQPGDIFFLEFAEIVNIHQQKTDLNTIENLIARRRQEWQAESNLPLVPYLIYGNQSDFEFSFSNSDLASSKKLTGIGASSGQIEGRIKVLLNYQEIANEINKDIILVVPYTDAGWSPILARAGGLIAESGGSLSHGAIIAREYKIPAVMDVTYATQLLRDGDRVKLNGKAGIVEILD
ncbi:phosphoenolpyruvate synthase/pyruvate phosphate dikinase [Xenococcus sp. PCC 7305]|uniref:glycerol-3-phosphate acyltransferase n=1 Tax=Xenococcus sp. PCC 7305 TaxID=102125 RepID=UPI0002ABFE5D|nr:glycerol-3-phosphate acyltransferase [Xenococcus sp. PCC 7305]ELS02094.1 phosphoenolpyruvate synthase/pyruvate phosphate dikinase [Xenococcus sp. PCC 7305]